MIGNDWQILARAYCSTTDRKKECGVPAIATLRAGSIINAQLRVVAIHLQ